MTHQPQQTPGGIPFYRNVRVLAVLTQVIFAACVLGFGWLLISTMYSNLQKQGIPISFAFLRQPAGFGISEGPTFDPSQSYLTAFGVGVVNTLRAAVAGIILATGLGIGVGLARLSRNWLLARLAAFYVETFRNVPLLLWLIFFSAILREVLPRLREGPALFWGAMLLSNRGIAVAWPQMSTTYSAFQPWWLLALVLGGAVWWYSRQRQRRRGVPGGLVALRHGLAVGLSLGILGFCVTWMIARLPEHVALDHETNTVFLDDNRNGSHDNDELSLPGVRVHIETVQGNVTTYTRADGTFYLPDEIPNAARVTFAAAPPLIWSMPHIQGFNYRGGLVLTPEFAALLVGLVVYTASFIAEIVRAGILAVPRGQREAAQALGLSERQTFTLVVFPQALRVIIPPLINQYLNLTKNSSLAIAVGYPDVFSVGLTINNQTGQAMPFVVLIMVTYLSLSLLTSLLLNLLNARLALQTR